MKRPLYSLSLGVAISLLSMGMVAPIANAQVSAPTAEDNSKVPAAFRADSKSGPGGFAPRGTPTGYTPNPDPRDFTGSYVSAGGGPPGGGGPNGPPGAGSPPGGAPGGMPSGASGSPPGAAPDAALAATPGANIANRESCVPSFGGGAYSTHLVSSAGRLTVVGEENHRLRRIFIGGQHPQEVQPSYAADSIAQWQGNTLVIDTLAIKGQLGVHLSERWTKQADGSIEIITTSTGADGKAQAARTSKLVWRPDITYVENICEDFGEAFGASYRQKLGK